MTVTARSRSGVFRPAGTVALHGHPRSMIHGIGQPWVAGLSPDDNEAFARPLGDGCDSRQTAQRGVIASLQGLPGFCEQRGKDDPSHSRQRCEDFRVMLLHLPRLALLRAGKLGGQPIDASVGIADLLVEQANTCN